MPAAATSHRTPPGRATAVGPTSWTRRGPVLLLAALLAVLLGVSGCSAGSDAESAGGAAGDAAVGQGAPEAAPGEAAQGEAAPDEAAPDDAAQGGSAGGSAEGGEEAGASTGVLSAGAGGGRRVVTSTIDVAVDDVGAAAQQVRTLAARVQGEVAGESSQGGESPRAEIVLRVPVDAAADVLTEVAALGEEVTRSSEAEPVETRIVDLTSRTATQRAGVERVRTLLQQATTLEDVLALEQELTRRQADLESVDAQRAALEDLAALATVTVRLTTPDDVDRPAAELPPFLQGLDAGWDALAASTTVVLVLLGGLLPFAVVGLLLLGAVLLGVRLVRRSRPEAGSTP